ncbi:hypothetical protein [Sphingobium sp. 15-1]|uniref:hypothetical protein n=1 Tax=Sphingobium sp. 15-1 TaxID=2729616 RepID=UPI00159CB6D5|nr:hypothetical protein [Sphingobium sp. 15-1]
MTSGVQVATSIPTTLHDWERTLSAALLRANEGNSDPIRSFEITPETLALHCGLGPEHAVDAEAAFRKALRLDPHLNWCLQHGTWRAHGRDQPNCLAMLVLSLLVDSLLDGIYEDKGQYRAKLSEWLGVERSFTDLRGIATMWKELVAWLDSRIAEGAPFRRLVLPEIPVTWTHIGYTRYLSFPTRRDVRLLVKHIERIPRAGFDPHSLIVQLEPVIRASSASHGMKIAFDDFKTALRSGAASIDHRFWRLVLRAREQCGHSIPSSVSLVMEFDEDGGRRYRVGQAADEVDATSAVLGDAVAFRSVTESSNIGAAVRRGVIFFRSSGMASWSAIGEPPPGNGLFHMGIAGRHARQAAGAIVKFVPTGTWLVSLEPVAIGVINDVLRRLGISDARQTVRSIGLVDGIRVGSAWLGQPRYLPYLEGASGQVEVTALDGGGGNLAWANGDLWSDAPVDGRFMLSDADLRWSRRATFVPVADLHPTKEIASYSIPVQEECRTTSGHAPSRTMAVAAGWDPVSDPNQDVIEALYASSRSGIGEGEAVAIIGRAHGRREWDVLRSLQEAGFFDARPRERWKGRVFTLRRPTLTPLRLGSVDGVLVSGAIPARLEADFRATVELQGGKAFRHRVEDALAPPTLGATGLDPVGLAKALGWGLVAPVVEPAGSAVKRLIETKIRGDGYIANSVWDWSLGRFRLGATTTGAVSLMRLVHPDGRDHDVYRVMGRAVRSFHSRHAAILDAHAEAGIPLFRYASGRIERIAHEGALPLEVSAALRQRTLLNSGAMVGGWSYAASAPDARWLSNLLPGLIADAPGGADGDPSMTIRRGRGSRRPMWINGGIAA